ncbi:hypothetical protein KAR91_62655 [Candidatus Pacearchaeota archaeon]|nr:hypothetical protein [Candidatus Pacearchaeota archaeon]
MATCRDCGRLNKTDCPRTEAGSNMDPDSIICDSFTGVEIAKRCIKKECGNCSRFASCPGNGVEVCEDYEYDLDSVVGPEKVEMTEADFPIKVSTEVAVLFDEHKKTNAAINKLMAALLVAAKDEVRDPWIAFWEKYPEARDIHRALIEKGMCTTYDYATKEVHLAPIRSK